VLEAIQSAHAVVLAPGSLYTSVAPNLLVAGVADAIRKSPAVKIYVCNLTTQPGETDGFTASGHLRAIEALLGPRVVEFCLMNSATERARSLLAPGTESEPVICDARWVRARGAVAIEADLMATQGDEIQHDPAKLGSLIMSLARTMRGASRLAAVTNFQNGSLETNARSNLFQSIRTSPRQCARRGTSLCAKYAAA
jgi:uncharacterized cofD-like protein